MARHLVALVAALDIHTEVGALRTSLSHVRYSSSTSEACAVHPHPPSSFGSKTNRNVRKLFQVMIIFIRSRMG